MEFGVSGALQPKHVKYAGMKPKSTVTSTGKLKKKPDVVS